MEWFLKTYIKIHDKNPELNKEEPYSETVKYATDPDVYSPHVTGGAIDLALLDKNKRMLDVGQWLEDLESANFSY
jgi:D-alanyl-D-alanine dipeptidase